ATELRVAGAGSSFGEESTVGLARRADAVARTASRVAEIPVHVFRRAAARAGAGESARLERGLRRAATRDLFATLAFTRALPEQDLDVLLDVAAHVKIGRGEHVYREGEAARELYFVADGLVQLQVEEGHRVRVRGYVGRGDFFGDAEIEGGGPRTHAAVSSGASELVAVPADVVRRLGRAHPDLLTRMRRVADEHLGAAHELVARAAANATQHVFRDLYRMQVARSLLVIDLETCVRCGHCAWACATAHDDGEARLVRRGDKMVARVDGRGDGAAPSSLLLPNSCQHCENPACMVDCPTGAIGKEAGEVFIRPELCTGCGACAKACPWENIHMAERPADAPRPSGAKVDGGIDFDLVAVKCDLCRESDGPACVKHCPTSSIFRLNPAEEIADVRQLFGAGFGGRAAASPGVDATARSAASTRGGTGPLVSDATIAAVGFAIVGGVMRARGAWAPGQGAALIAGVLAALGMLGLLAYAAPKRLVRRGKPSARAAVVTSKVAPALAIHVALGVVTLGLALAHAPWPPRGGNASGAALLGLLVATSAAAAFVVAAYKIVPRRLARIERRAALPEDYAAARRGLVDRLYRAASGRSDVVKKLLET
ncbi:MAG TPA: cyclic nucleotide-binding domain-containing protein, partial [Byssovorax sp.]